MSKADRVHVEVRIGSQPDGELVVRRVRGREAISAPYRFEVELVSASGASLDLAGLVGAPARLRLDRPSGLERVVQGVCTAAEHSGVRAGAPGYVLTIAPRLQLLGQARQARVFQELTAVEIVSQVLKEHGIDHALRLSGTYPKREMCVQYRESDLAFVSRLLADEGIAYWFSDEDGQERMVLGDAPSAFEPLAEGGELPYRPTASPREDEYLTELREIRASAATRATTRDRDFQHPDVLVQAVHGAPPGPEVYEHPSGRSALADNDAVAGKRLELLRLEATAFQGAATCIRLGAGRVLQVTDHPDPRCARELLVTAVDHVVEVQRSPGSVEGFEAEHRVRFRAIPAEQQFRPSRPAAPRLPGLQTATVVGPAGEEIHPDRFGRVKVQFHWDREGRRDERASAWVRVAQAWAGGAFGAQFTPRIGQEVVLRFLDGDPDRPVATGAVYNGANLTPVLLPDDKTVSTLRTASSPGSGGSNELRLEDRAGAEQVYLHAQRDEAIEVRADKVQRVQGNEAHSVAHHRTQHVRGDQQLRVGGEDGEEVAGRQALRVSRDRDTSVHQSQREEIVASQTVSVGANRRVAITAASLEEVGGAAAVTIGTAHQLGVVGAESVFVGGALTRQVGLAFHQVVGDTWSERIGGDARRSIGGGDAIDVTGAVGLSAGADLDEATGGGADVDVHGEYQERAGSLELVADAFKLLVAGKKVLSIDAAGIVSLAGTNVALAGTAVALSGASISKSGPKPPPPAQVRLASPRDLARAPALAEFTLVDHDGAPVPHEPFELTFADGSTWKGTTDARGRARAPASKKGQYQVTFKRHAK